MVNAIVSQVPLEWVEKIRTDVIWTARKQNVCRRLTRIRPIGDSIGIQTWVYDKASEVSDAQLNYGITITAEDQIKLTRSSINVPVLHKEFKIDARDIAAAQMNGVPLNTWVANSASYKVTNLENALVLKGYAADGTNYDINGLYLSAANDYSTSKDFGTAGNALDAVTGAIALMMEDEIYGPYNLVLNTTQYMELAKSILGSGAGMAELPMIKDLIGGELFVNNWQTAGTGMLLTQPNAGHHELIVAKDLDISTEVEPKVKHLWGMVYECVVPVVYDANAICKLSAI